MMISTRKLITWQPVLTDHQAFTFAALGHKAGVPLISFVASIEDAVRKEQGWSDTQVRSLDRRLIPKGCFLRYCFQQLYKHRSDIHIFASPFQQPRLILCMMFAALLGIEFYLISEPYSTNADGYLNETSQLLGKFKAKLRPLLYRIYVLMLRGKSAGIFSISPLAFIQYKQAGFPTYKLFPFGYFIPVVEKLNQLKKYKYTDNSCLRIIFVGSLIRRKGVDLLQEAIKLLYDQGVKVNVDIYGSGNLSLICSNHNAIRYCGKIPFGDAQDVIARYDLLVLPSRHDGWGVVVNEALCAGVPVVCSDAVGAGKVASVLGAGLCFASGDPASLSNVLAKVIKDPTLLEMMQASAPLAAEALQPDVAAQYMLNVIRAPAGLKSTIPPPWYIN